jgi:hypothetical protein
MNSSVNSYFQFSSVKVDSGLLLLCHKLNNKAFLIHCVKLSPLTSGRYIPTFSLQRFVHLLPHTPCQHSCHLSQTKMVNMYNKDFFNIFLVLNKRTNCKNNEILEEIIHVFPMKTNSFY